MPSPKTNRPTIDEYFGLEAEAYGTSKWMERNQRETTQNAVYLMQSPEIGDELSDLFSSNFILDLGCGTGYSSLQLLENFSRVIGMDFSRDMMEFIPESPSLLLLQADLRYLPFRENIFPAVFSISAYNFVAEGARSRAEIRNQVRGALSDLLRILLVQGRVVIEFYPTQVEQEIFLEILKQLPFFGGMLITDQNTRKEKKYLLLRKNPS